jgi:hypothetical protein
MTDEEINKTIAEHLGKKIINLPFIPNKITVDENTVFTKEAVQQWHSVYPRGASVNVIPNYCGDLNLIHEAEKMLTDEEYFDYCRKYLPDAQNAVIAQGRTATARQRAEAFLKTVGKW